MVEFSKEDQKYPDCLNLKDTADWGITLCQGLKAFAETDYETALNLIKSVRFDYQTKMLGSRAQGDIFNQVLIQSAIKSGNHIIAKQLLEERWSHCGGRGSILPNSCLNQRLETQIETLMI